MNLKFLGISILTFVLLLFASTITIAYGSNNVQTGAVIPNMEMMSVLGISVPLPPAEGNCAFIQILDGTDSDSREIMKKCIIIDKRFREKGLKLISIFQNASEDDILDFAHNLQVKWPLVMDDDATETPFSAKLGVREVPFNMLVDSKGTVLATQLNGDKAHEIIAKHLGISLDEIPPLDQISFDWREKFYSLYRLKEHEVLKRIAPPFIPERKEYYFNEESYQAELIPRGPKLFVFHWDGTLKNWGMSFGGDRSPLEHVLTFPLGIPRYEFEGSEEVLNIDMPGDWIVRNDTSTKERIEALETILQKELNQPVQFEQQKVEREVTVAKGKFEYKPLDHFASERRGTDIFVFSDMGQVREGGGGGSGSLHEFMVELGDRLNHRLIDETESSNVDVSWRWKQHRPPEEDVDLDGYFEQIGKQTSLRFVSKKREVLVWIITL